MSLEIDRDWIPEYQLWVDLIQLTCDCCGERSPWAEPGDFLAGGDWSHLLGLDCCPDCRADFYASREDR
jgi:hypothetical protein